MEVVTGWFSSVSKQINAAVVGNAKEEKIPSDTEKEFETVENVTSDEAKTETVTDPSPIEVENVHPSFEDVANKAYAGAKVFTNTFVSFANKIVKDSADELKTVFETKSILSELEEENKKFVEEQERQKILNETSPSPAWRGCTEETNIKKQILSLSLDSRNFLRDPPAGCDFSFDYDTVHSTALAMLNEDPNLRKMRFELVPKQIKEGRFWRNYFYRVALIKQSVALRNFSQQENENASSSESSSKSTVEPVAATGQQDQAAIVIGDDNDPMLSPVGTEFVSDSGELPDTLDADMETARQMLGILDTNQPENQGSNPNGAENEWEKELLAELNDDYELVSEQTGKTEHEWEEELSELLTKESTDEPKK